MLPLAKGVDLFVYGTLMSEEHLYSLTGRHFRRREAELPGYERIIPNAGYPYIIPNPGARVKGYLLYDIDSASLSTLDQYEDEGVLYHRRRVEVEVGGKKVVCETYLGDVEGLKAHFGEAVEVDRRVKEFLETKVRDLIEEMDGPGTTLPADPAVAVCARTELLGDAIEELVETHFRFPPLFRYLAEKRLRLYNLPSLARVKENPRARVFADAYLAFAVRHIIFNQLEEKVRRDFYGRVKVPHPFYEHTISALASLRFLNKNEIVVREMMRAAGADRLHEGWEYLDYAIQGSLIANRLYDHTQIERIVSRIRDHRQVSVTPLGAEVELSFVGTHAPQDPGGLDPHFDGFYYFHDFDLARRCWKLGGHVDDHRLGRLVLSQVEGMGQERSRGFFEYAFGRFRIFTDVSRPVTNDPWVLSQLILQASLFAGIPPHSLHLTFQPAQSIRLHGENILPDLIALLILGGDLRRRPDGSWQEKRIADGEILDPQGLVYFSEDNRHFSNLPQSKEKVGYTQVIEYKFPRLCLREYDAFTMALKGYHYGRNPRPFCSDFSRLDTQAVQAESDALKVWARSPTPLSTREIEGFMTAVEEGLVVEDRGRPGHSGIYIASCLEVIERELREKNELLKAK